MMDCYKDLFDMATTPSFESFESLSEKDIGVSRDLLKRVQIIFEN